MAVLLQVAAEYGALASGNAGTGSLRDAFDRLTSTVPAEYILFFAGAVIIIYVITK